MRLGVVAAVCALLNLVLSLLTKGVESQVYQVLGVAWLILSRLEEKR